MTRIQQAMLNAAQDGDRVVVNGKTIWGGMGNRAGLHSFQFELLNAKWKKSGPRFEAKIMKLKKGDTVEIFSFRNITRNRGIWMKSLSGVVGQGYMRMF
jgi:hypothetical protein